MKKNYVVQLTQWHHTLNNQCNNNFHKYGMVPVFKYFETITLLWCITGQSTTQSLVSQLSCWFRPKLPWQSCRACYNLLQCNRICIGCRRSLWCDIFRQDVTQNLMVSKMSDIQSTAPKTFVLVLENVQSHVNTIQTYMFDVQEMLQCETMQQRYEK